MSPEELAKARAVIGCSQFRLARTAQVSRFKISQYEMGYSNLTSEEMERVEGTLKLLTTQHSVKRGKGK